MTDDQRILTKREKTRERVRLHRERRAKERQLKGALAAVVQAQAPVRQGTKQTLLKSSLLRHGVTVDKLVKTRAQALEATKLRLIGTELRESPDFPTRLRGAEQLDKDLQRAGEMPDDTVMAPHIIVNVLMLREPVPERLRHSLSLASQEGLTFVKDETLPALTSGHPQTIDTEALPSDVSRQLNTDATDVEVEQ